jgi:hypothetical protein
MGQQRYTRDITLATFQTVSEEVFSETQRDKEHKAATPRSCSYPVVVSFFSWSFFS